MSGASWAEKPPGLRVSRTLDLSAMLAPSGRRLATAWVALEPPLLADAVEISDVAINLFLADCPAAPEGTRWRVRFGLTYSDGAQDEIVAWQPIGRAGEAAALAIGGAPITIGGEMIHA